MANFDIAKAKLLKVEGEFQSLTTDCGNYLTKNDCKKQENIIGTKYGIAAPTLRNYYQKPITMQDMKDLDMPTAVEIYKKNYWNTIKGDQIENQSIAETLFDAGVNQRGGPAGAIKMMQNVLKARDSKIVADGILGPATIKAINANADQELFDKFQQKRKEAYFVAGKPEFIKGWLNRLNGFKFVPQVKLPAVNECQIDYMLQFKSVIDSLNSYNKTKAPANKLF